MFDVLRRPVTVVALVVVAIGCWSVLTPEGGGPDETTHLVRSAGLARGQFFEGDGSYAIPDTVLPPDISCWAFQPTVPASCAPERETVGAILEMPSTADDYPIWSHLYAGVASRLPGAGPLWWARLANVALAGALVGTALFAVRRRPLAAASVIAALTPMAWFSFGIVNPSSMAIAGAIAMWAGLVHRPDLQWLTAAGFAAVALPRRDGLIWACVGVTIWLLIDDERFATWWRTLRFGPKVAMATATAATLAWGVTAESTTSRLVVLAPLAFVGGELFRRARARIAVAGDPIRVAGTITAVLVAPVGMGLAAYLRPNGWDAELAGRVLGEAGPNLVEAIGRLGWLDAPLPGPAIVGWVALLGLLAGASLADRTRWLVGAAAIVATGIVAAWIFELYQGNTSGTYWQGRYTLPLLAGAPIVLGATRIRTDVERRIAIAVGVGALAIVNVALWAATRRFGVGIGGSLLPWNWDTYGAPIPTLVVLVVHALATGALLVTLVARSEPTDAAGRSRSASMAAR